jgi:HD-GYP domain-containing protein (c-di-GMP phosphodiesterase class II)
MQQAHTDLIIAYDATIAGWSRAMVLRDQHSQGHAQRVADMTLSLARVMNVPMGELVHMRRGALLHDIGMIGVPEHILLQDGPLTHEEVEQVNKHPEFAYDLLSPIEYLQPALAIPYCHHENWDGTGYPRGLKGDEIPLAARIFAVVDLWDVLINGQHGRKGMSKQEALDHIREQSGTQFDPEVVDAFLQLCSQFEDRGLYG